MSTRPKGLGTRSGCPIGVSLIFLGNGCRTNNDISRAHSLRALPDASPGYNSSADIFGSFLLVGLLLRLGRRRKL